MFKIVIIFGLVVVSVLLISGVAFLVSWGEVAAKHHEEHKKINQIKSRD